MLPPQVSEAGVHRPPVSGIHGKEKHGAYSLVLSGGYEDDEDRGEEFTYTGEHFVIIIILCFFIMILLYY